jgi:hypothetical protein
MNESPNVTDDLVAFLRARLEEDERIAVAASGGIVAVSQWSGRPEEWRWECCTDDTPLDVDLAIAGGEETLDHADHYRVGLRSVQQYPTTSVGPLSHLVIDGEEVRPQDARHVARYDPARVLREVEAKRAIVADYQKTKAIVDAVSRKLAAGTPLTPGDGRDYGDGCRELCALRGTLDHLAAVYSDHADYRPA